MIARFARLVRGLVDSVACLSLALLLGCFIFVVGLSIWERIPAVPGTDKTVLFAVSYEMERASAAIDDLLARAKASWNTGGQRHLDAGRAAARRDILAAYIEPYSEWKRYSAVYADPYVQYLRNAVNGFLSGSNDGIFVEGAITSTDTNGRGVGLASVDPAVLRSRFIVFAFGDAPFGGGKNITVVFRGKLHQAYTAWVYRLAGNDGFELRGFWENEQYTKTLGALARQYKDIFDDPDHGL